MNAEELKELEQFADKLRQIPPITDFIQAVNLMMYSYVKQRDERIAALTEELRGIERILDDPRIHNTHTIEEVLHERLSD